MISMISNQRFAVFVVVLVMAILAPGAFIGGHDGGASIEQVVDGYLIDIGYSPETPTAGEQTRFDFAVYNSDTQEEVDFTDIWVRILDEEDNLLFAGGLNKAEFGLTGLTYLFSYPGSYEIFVRFSDGSTSVVETTASVEVSKSDEEFSFKFGVSEVVAFVAGIVVALVFMYLIPNRSNSQQVMTPKAFMETNRYTQNLKKLFPHTNTVVSIVVGLLCAVLAFYVTKTLLSENPLAFLSRDEGTSLESEQPVQEGEVSVVLTREGFKPNEITIKKGTTVVFSTDIDRPFWPASDLHPTHEVYSDFDPKRKLEPDETWSFKFDRVGEWNMHDHLRSYFNGSIRVVE